MHVRNCRTQRIGKRNDSNCCSMVEKMWFSRKYNSHHLVPVHRDNAGNRDWTILLEANTIVGPSQARFRVACATQERKIVRRLMSCKFQLYLTIRGFDPRIHVLFFCPQLYKHDEDGTLVAMQGEEIGKFIAHALHDKATVRRPWYNPMEVLPEKPLIGEAMLNEFDTLLVEPPGTRPLLTAPVERRADSS
jgi:hypothetical protein